MDRGIEPAVMASEIERLPDLSGLLKLASVSDWQVVRLTPMTGAVPVRPRRPSILTSPPTAGPAVRTASPPAAESSTSPDDMYLHSEPGEIFFDIPSSAPGSIELTPLAGSIQLSGDEHFQVD
jgi:hypothetical protein